MLATGVFVGEQKSEAEKRCERAKPNAARLLIHAAQSVAPRHLNLEHLAQSSTADPCFEPSATRWHLPPPPVSLVEKSTFEVPVC